MPDENPDYSVDPNSGAAPQPGGVGNPLLVPSATGTQSEEPASEDADNGDEKTNDNGDEASNEPTSDQDGATDTGQLQPPAEPSAEESSNTRTAKKAAAKKSS